jgi:hypothetical protein
VIRAAIPADSEQAPSALAADLVRRAAPTPTGVTVAAIIVQTGSVDPGSTSLTTLASRLADDVKNLLQGGDRGAPVSAAVAVAGPLAAAHPGGRAELAEPAVPGDPGDPIVIDRARRRASVDGELLDLTYREFELLAFLAEHPGRVFSRAHLLRTVWDHAQVGSRTVDVHVRRLRIKLGREAARITTVRSVGYRLEPASAAGRSLEPVA